MWAPPYAIPRHATTCPRYGARTTAKGRETGAASNDDPNDALPRAHVRAQRDGPVESLGRPPRPREVPAVREVRVLRRPERGRDLRHLPVVQVPVLGSGRGGLPRERARPGPARAQ